LNTRVVLLALLTCTGVTPEVPTSTLLNGKGAPVVLSTHVGTEKVGGVPVRVDEGVSAGVLLAVPVRVWVTAAVPEPVGVWLGVLVPVTVWLGVRAPLGVPEGVTGSV
jgi:hypothetical protein